MINLSVIILLLLINSLFVLILTSGKESSEAINVPSGVYLPSGVCLSVRSFCFVFHKRGEGRGQDGKEGDERVKGGDGRGKEGDWRGKGGDRRGKEGDGRGRKRTGRKGEGKERQGGEGRGRGGSNYELINNYLFFIYLFDYSLALIN